MQRKPPASCPMVNEEVLSVDAITIDRLLFFFHSHDRVCDPDQYRLRVAKDRRHDWCLHYDIINNCLWA
ncbi:MAG: hypothetical protein HY801_05655 [Candidatus Lindowbacteria bacterium]|nr:hypothetical protein [Candidatus Lindowbacteria bacterium]